MHPIYVRGGITLTSAVMAALQACGIVCALFLWARTAKRERVPPPPLAVVREGEERGEKDEVEEETNEEAVTE